MPNFNTVSINNQWSNGLGKYRFIPISSIRINLNFGHFGILLAFCTKNSQKLELEKLNSCFLFTLRHEISKNKRAKSNILFEFERGR